MGTGSGSQLDSDTAACAKVRQASAANMRLRRFGTPIAIALAIQHLPPLIWLGLSKRGAV